MKFDPASKIQDLLQFGEFGGVNPSITDSATYTFLQAKDMLDTFHGEAEDYFLYSRHWNPSNKYLADAMAVMEGTESAWLTASGMAAITNTILQLCNTGDHIVSSITTYGGTFAFLSNYLKKFNIEVTFVDITDLDSIKKAMKPNTKVIYTETMTNPMLQISDIPEIKKIAENYGAKLVVDNTFTPMMVAPKLHGADIVVYSLTKYVNGKNDLVAGAICADQDFINSLIDLNTGSSMLLGPVLDPLRSSQILKNMHTLHIRMKQHSRNASYLADRFKDAGIPVIYPGHKVHKGYEILTRMLNKEFGYGGMLAIDMKTTEAADSFMEIMEEKGVGYLAVSLGYFKTLFSCSGKSTSSEVPPEIQKQIGMSDGLVRFSMGLDNDIERTWDKIHSTLKELHIIK